MALAPGSGRARWHRHGLGRLHGAHAASPQAHATPPARAWWVLGERRLHRRGSARTPPPMCAALGRLSRPPYPITMPNTPLALFAHRQGLACSAQLTAPACGVQPRGLRDGASSSRAWPNKCSCRRGAESAPQLSDWKAPRGWLARRDARESDSLQVLVRLEVN